MFSRINFHFRTFCRTAAHNFKSEFNRNPLNLVHYARKPLLAATLYAFIPQSISLDENFKVSHEATPAATKPEIEIKKPSLIFRIWNVFVHIVRFCHLLIIFAPPIILSPLLLFKKTEGYWMDSFVKAVERSGVVFIKAFQYLSHRRDIIGP